MSGLNWQKTRDAAGWFEILNELEAALGGERRSGVRERQAAFLGVYEESFNASASAAAADVSRVQFYRWREEDPVFRAALDRLRDRIQERVEREIFRRAVMGVERPVWHRGEVVGSEVAYSDRLLLALARRLDPSGWGERPASAATPERGETAAMVRRVLADPEAIALAQRLADRLSERSPSPAVESVLPELAPRSSPDASPTRAARPVVNVPTSKSC